MLCGRVVAKTGKTNLPGNFMSLLRLRLAYHFPPNLIDPGVWLRAFSGKSLRVHRFSALPDLPFSYQLPIRKLFPVRKMGHFPCSLPALSPPPPPPRSVAQSLASMFADADRRARRCTHLIGTPPAPLFAAARCRWWWKRIRLLRRGEGEVRVNVLVCALHFSPLPRLFSRDSAGSGLGSQGG